jgi:hypothetical protein
VAEVTATDGVSAPEVAEGSRGLRFRHDRDGPFRQLVVNLCEQPEVEDGGCRFALRLEGRERWHLCIEFLTLDDEDRCGSVDACRRRGGRRAWVDEHKKRRRAELVQRAPRLETDSYVLRRAYERSVADFAALRIKGEDVSAGEFVIAAGIP